MLRRTRIVENIQNFDDNVQFTQRYKYTTKDFFDLSQKLTFDSFDLNFFNIFQRETREIKNTLNNVFETSTRHHDRESRLKYIELKLFYENFVE